MHNKFLKVEGIEKLMNKFIEQKETIDTQMIALETKRENLEKENISLKEQLLNVQEEEKRNYDDRVIYLYLF